MAYPGDPVSKGPGGFEHAPLTPDDLEQLATAFRPSWELDEAPFTGTGTLSAADVQALQGGGIHSDVRMAVASAASPFPPTRTNTVEVLGSVVLDQSIVVQEAPPPPPVHRPPPPAAYVPAASAPPATPLEATRIVPRRVGPEAPRARVASFGSEESPFARPSKKPLWLALGGGAVVLAGVGIWAASGSSAESPAPAQSSVADTATHAPTTIPLPTLVAPAAMAPPVTATTIAVTTPSALPRAAAPTPVAAAPSPLPTPQHYVAPSPAPHPVSAPQPAPKPAPHPKGGTTIVHDVPF